MILHKENTDDEKRTSQCPVNMYYDVNKGEKTLSTDGQIYCSNTVKKIFQRMFDQEELPICEKNEHILDK